MSIGGSGRRHAGPPLWLVATMYTFLFLAGLYPVTIFGGQPHFPGPWESPETIAAFFQARPNAVRVCAFLQFGAAIPLGIFAASIASRLQFLGARAAGVSIALFGGIATAVTMIAASSALWVMAQPGIVAGPRRTSGALLARSGIRRRRLRRSVRAPGRGRHDSGGVHEAHSEMDRRAWGL